MLYSIQTILGHHCFNLNIAIKNNESYIIHAHQLFPWEENIKRIAIMCAQTGAETEIEEIWENEREGKSVMHYMGPCAFCSGEYYNRCVSSISTCSCGTCIYICSYNICMCLEVKVVLGKIISHRIFFSFSL